MLGQQAESELGSDGRNISGTGRRKTTPVVGGATRKQASFVDLPPSRSREGTRASQDEDPYEGRPPRRSVLERSTPSSGGRRSGSRGEEEGRVTEESDRRNGAGSSRGQASAASRGTSGAPGSESFDAKSMVKYRGDVETLALEADKALERLMTTVRNNDVRDLRRQLLRYRNASSELCAQPGGPGAPGARWTPVTSAADYGFAEVIRLFIDFGISLDVLDGNGWSAAHAVARIGNVEVIDVLAEAGCDLDIRSRDGWTPLHVAVRKGVGRAVDALLGRRVKVNTAGPRGWTALHLAVASGRADLVETLLRSGARGGVLTDMAATPLYVAAQDGFLDIVELLEALPGGQEVDQQTLSGWSPLHVAAAKGHGRIVADLVEVGGADVNLRTKDGCTPLYLAVQNSHVSVARFLLERGADVGAFRDNVWTPIHVAVDLGNASLIDLLLSGRNAGLSAVAAGSSGFLPLHIALFNRNLDLTRLLISRGADVNKGTLSGGLTPCHLAAVEENRAFIGAVLESKAVDANVKDIHGWTPIHYAVMRDRPHSVAALLGVKGCQVINDISDIPRVAAQVDAVDKAGCTALHLAAKSGSTEIVFALIRAGAGLDLTNDTGYTPLHLAVQYSHQQVVELLLKHKAFVDPSGRSMWRPLHLAGVTGHVGVAAALIGAGAEVGALTGEGETCLHLAAHHQRSDLVAWLVSGPRRATCGVDVQSRGGWTPLHVACQYDLPAAVRALLAAGAGCSAALDDGTTPLYVAALNGREEVISALLDRRQGSKFSSPDLSRDSREEGEENLVPDVNASTAEGWRSVHVAALRGHTEALERLVALGANPDASARNGETALHLAAKARGMERVVAMLLRLGAEADRRCHQGLTPLYRAVEQGRLGAAECLLQAGGVDVNRRHGEDETTVLHLAALGGNAELVEMLIGHGANTEMQTAGGMTSLAIALRRRHHDVAQLLVQAAAAAQTQAEPDVTGEHGSSDTDTGNREHIQADIPLDIPT